MTLGWTGKKVGQAGDGRAEIKLMRLCKAEATRSWLARRCRSDTTTKTEKIVRVSHCVTLKDLVDFKCLHPLVVSACLTCDASQPASHEPACRC